MNLTEYKRQALDWFSSLPAGRKSYFKKHYRLTNDEAITRFWFFNVRKQS